MVAAGLRHLQGLEPALQWLRAAGARRLVVDSRQVRPGDAFVAWPGAAHDARQFVPQALAAGACACLVAAEGVQAWAFEDERVAAMPDLKRQLGGLCAAFHGQPSAHMSVLAVTGTNGKTSTAWWLAQASGLLGQRSALVGTLGIGEPPVGSQAGHWEASGLTTPDPALLHASLAAFLQNGVRRCAIEASSIGLEEHRLDDLQIQVALFTNFTQDHLDYHGTMQRYWAAKRRLFDWPTLKAAVINVDDPVGAALFDELCVQRPDLDLWSVGMTHDARLNAREVRHTATGMAFACREAGHVPCLVEVPFVGSYNIQNLLGVMAALRCLGHTGDEVQSVLPRLSAVPGRMQAQGGAGEPLVLVDYAHTPDALQKALEALRPLADARQGRLWCVFGCGGDRDRSKRAQMGAVAAQWADAVVLTSDNPRGEDPLQILSDIQAGWVGSTPPVVEPDRRLAVAHALAESACRDVVLVAGKGHEAYQEIKGVRHPCADPELVAQGLAARQAAGFMSLRDAADALGCAAALRGEARLPIRRVHTDTRSLQPGDLYVALRGERFDGHEFLLQARQAGAVAALAERGLDEAGLPGLVVNDSLEGLQALAQSWRAQLRLPVIGVTGSNGKTTVTQMCASILRAWCGDRAAFTRGNLNNHIGVPLSVLTLRAGAAHGHQAAVLELGMNHPGEVAQLASIAQPTVAVVNNAQREHQEFMHTVEAVARENAAVLQALPPQGTAVFPADDAYAALWQSMSGTARVWRFAWAVSPQVPSQAEVRGWAEWRDDHWALRIESPVGLLQTTLRLPGRHNVHNALAAASATLAAGAPLEAVAQGLASFEAVSGRSKLIRLQHQGRALTLIDDTYNANPDSVRAAIDVLADLPGPRLLVLGDMGEVGEQGPAFHAEVGAYAHSRGIEALWTLGLLGAHAAAAYGSGARHFESMEALTEALAKGPNAPSLLVKGSRFMRMERAVAVLQSMAEEGR